MAILLALALLVLAWVPDLAVLRPKLIWGRAALLAVTSAALVALAWRGRGRCPWPGFLLVALLPAAVAGASALHVDVVSPRLLGDEFERLLWLPVACWTAAQAAASARHRRWLTWAVCVAVIPIGLYALMQHLADPLGLPVRGQPRASATFGNAVLLGAFFVLTLPLCATTALFAPGRVRWAGAVATGVGLPGLLATGSLGAWAAFGAAALLAIVLLIPAGALRRGVLVGAAVIGVVLVFLAPGVLERQRAHTLIWSASWQMVLDHPAGVGAGQFHLEFPPYASDELLSIYPRRTSIINDAHCEPLQLLVELGWPGLIAATLAALVLLRAVGTLLRRLPWDDSERPMLVGVLCGVTGMLLLSLISPDQRFTISAMLLGTFIGWTSSLAPARDQPLPAGRIGRGLVALAALGLIVFTATSTWTRYEATSLPHDVGGDLRGAAPGGSLSAADLEAVVELSTLSRRRPNDPAVTLRLGEALYRARRYEESIAAFGHALELLPGHPLVVRALGIAEETDRRFEDAIPHLREALAVFPDDVELRYRYAFSSWHVGDLKTALQETEAILVEHPDHARARTLRERLRE